MFYMHDSAGWGWGWWVLMTIGMVAVWAAIIFGVVWFVRDRRPDQGPPTPTETPEQILKRRLAQGEISVEEYERLRAAMTPPSPEPPAPERRTHASVGSG